MKKTPAILKRLNDDLMRLRTSLEEVPAIIIDDESDQASVNTRKPTATETKERTATNREIVRLLKMLPRAQYIGYTATPFANVFVDANDADDLFPKDYIIALSRPADYMGVTDFYDFADDGTELADDERPEGFQSRARAFIRDVRNDDTEAENLPRAIDSFILSGAIKLFRRDHGVSVPIDHHTMLIHRSTRQSDHERDADLVERTYAAAEIGSNAFYERLRRLWTEDFEPVSQAHAPTLIHPESFNTLRSYIDQCIVKLEASGQPVRIVNGDKQYEDQLPNFDRDSIWGILVGGTKLSRGYTVEGLTISYYRRLVRTADTLMQVGRWFGFRRNYSDLVRVFFGRSEPDGKNRRMDLYAAFGAISRDEETFRRDLKRYSDPSVQPAIRPIQVPPLVPSHMLMPTSRNKMYNAVVRHQNFGGQWKERVLPADDTDGRKANAALFRNLVSKSGLGELHDFGYQEDSDKPHVVRWKGFVITVETDAVLAFLSKYHWIGNQPLMQRDLEFIRAGFPERDSSINRWLIVLPQRADAGNRYWWKEHQLSVFERARVHSGGFRVFSEQRHRVIASHLADVELASGPIGSVVALAGPHTAVVVCYPTVGTDDKIADGEVSDSAITIGFGIQYPRNKIMIPITFGVRDEKNADAITVAVG
jgi:hypothetical protein